MKPEPSLKRAYVFFDGQNLFRSAKDAFGFNYPNYDPIPLSKLVCGAYGWSLEKVFFYTGVPDASDDPRWNHFWTSKLAHMGRQGIAVFSRPLRYRNQTIRLPDGSEQSVLVGQEKGIDVRLALDVVRCARANLCDVVVIFSQDQDLSEVADEIRMIAAEQGRWIKIASAFLDSPTMRNRRGINKTDWMKIARSDYERCVDTNDYRPKPKA